MNTTLRKFIVSLKRKPQNIPLLFLVLACMAYTFNLTPHSNASMYVSSGIIALYVFLITLCSILVIFSFLNTFAKNQPRPKLMMVVVFAFAAVQLGLDMLYINTIHYETAVKDNPVPVTADIAASGNWTIIHMALIGIAVLLIITMPIYHKLLLKIDTSVEDPELAESLEINEVLVDGEI